jgi:hypothetical protein
MGLKRGYCKETLQIMGVLKQSSEESVWMKEWSDRVTVLHYLCRDGSVVIATRYGLEDRGIESRGGTRFSAPLQTGSRTYPAYCKMGTGSSSSG